jgi:pimeloyl-ACP methyl ester carboxylesterase
MDKKSSKLLPIFIGCISIIVILAVISIGIFSFFFSRPGTFEITEYHPFRSRQAQERYLALYDQREKSWPVPYETRLVDTSYGPTYVRISGPENAPPLVLLHGAAGNSLQWIPNIADLSKDYRVYVIDNIYDHGRSIYLREMDSADDFVDWLDDLFDQLELGNDINLVKEWAYEAYVAARSFKPKSLASPTVLSNSDLISLRVRTLFLVGENEKLYSPQAAVERLNSVAPQIETAIIPNAGHDLTMARAWLVNQKILEFLGRP